MYRLEMCVEPPSHIGVYLYAEQYSLETRLLCRAHSAYIVRKE